MKGILLAGGRGTRLFPVTKAVSKQMLPIYNKPLIYYPLATLMLAGIREILIITNPQDQAGFENLLGDGSNFGITLKYAIQDNPRGIAESIIIAEEFTAGGEFCLILGDNIFYGPGLGRDLMKHRNISGGTIFGFQVKNPNEYGIAVFDLDGDLVDLIEKPSKYVSNIAVTGLYFYDSSVVELAKNLLPSQRGELEITDLNKKLLEMNNLSIQMLPRGTSWLDTGTFDGLHDASSFVRIMEERTGVLIGDPTEVARHQGWI
jgi:glucose-1-phosphate thymidylyltransferase